MKKEKRRSDKMNMARYVYDLTSEDIDSIAEYERYQFLFCNTKEYLFKY